MTMIIACLLAAACVKKENIAACSPADPNAKALAFPSEIPVGAPKAF